MSRIRLLGPGRLSVPLRVVAWFMRLAVGATFIFSGFSKAVDPYGTYYKISDYVAAIGWHIPDGLMLTAAFLLFAVEFVVGAMLVLGSFRRTSPLCATIVMLFMLPLSLWLALAEPVADCGCFGDAIIISNWSTFWKNVGLIAACVWLMFFNRRIHWLVTPALQWIALTISVAYVALVGLIGYNIQPPVDFRPYKTGMELTAGIDSHGDADSNVRLIYSDADGVEHSFGLEDELPGDKPGWTFLRQETADGTARTPEADNNLRIWSEDGEEDVTADVLYPDSRRLILFMPRLDGVSVRDTWPINSLYGYCRANDIDMIAVVASSPEGIEAWRDISLGEYPVYTAEDTSIKEVVRGNPALVYTERGKVVWKQTLGSLDVDALTEEGSRMKLPTAATDTFSMLKHLTRMILVTTAVLVLFSFIPPSWRLHKLIRRRRRMRLRI